MMTEIFSPCLNTSQNRPPLNSAPPFVAGAGGRLTTQTPRRLRSSCSLSQICDRSATGIYFVEACLVVSHGPVISYQEPISLARSTSRYENIRMLVLRH